MSERPDPATRLARAIGPLGFTASVINVIIGSSIFVFPAVVAGALGAAGILPYLIAAFAMGLIALCFAESGSRVLRPVGPTPTSRPRADPSPRGSSASSCMSAAS